MADGLHGSVRGLSEDDEALVHEGREPQGTLRLSASPDFGATFLSPLISAFAGLYPDVAIDVDLSPGGSTSPPSGSTPRSGSGRWRTRH